MTISTYCIFYNIHVFMPPIERGGGPSGRAPQKATHGLGIGRSSEGSTSLTLTQARAIMW